MTQQEESHLELDIIVTTLVQKQKLGIGLVESGNTITGEISGI